MKAYALALLLAACSPPQQQATPRFNGMQDEHTMLDRYTMDKLEQTYTQYAKLTVVLIKNGGDKEALKAADNAAYEHLKATRAAFDRHDAATYAAEVAQTRAAFKATLAHADLGEKK